VGDDHAAIPCDPVNYIGKMVFDQDVIALMKSGYAFLHKIKAIDRGDMPATAINEGPLKRALAEMKATAPLGEIRGHPRSAFK
jgi:hypothetical protein